MIFVVDTNVLSNAFKNIKIETFKTFWFAFDKLISNGHIISTREVFRELETFFIIKDKCDNDTVMKWLIDHKKIFLTPTSEVCSVVSQIFKNPHYKQIIKKDNILTGRPEADPFVIAQAAVIDGVVVSSEVYKENAAKIPNICNDMSVKFIDADAFFSYVNKFFDDNLVEEYYRKSLY